MANIIVNSLTGNFTGTSGADTFIFTAPSAFANFTGTIDGLGGNDTIQLIGAATPTITAYGPSTQFAFNLGTLSSIEAIKYSSVGGEQLNATFAYGQISDGTTLIGGAGRDGVLLVSQGGFQTLAVPAFSFQNWGVSTSGQLFDLDFIILINSGLTGGMTLNTRDNVPGVQVLFNDFGPASFNGSNSTDYFDISYGGTIAGGGAGDDYFHLNQSRFGNNYAELRLDGGTGFDRLVVDTDWRIEDSAILNIEALRFEQSLVPNALPAHLTIDTATTGANPTIQIEGKGAITLNLTDTSFSGAGLTFATGADVMTDIHGTDQADTITGTAVNDAIYSYLGNDSLTGLAGNDQLIGDKGDDSLNGGSGNDLLNGGVGIDTASYSTAASGVTVSLAQQAEFGFSGAQNTIGAGLDTLTGIENLTGSSYADKLIGSSGKNVLSGDDGNDQLIGNGGNDKLLGGNGNDLLIGGNGNDIMNGGDGIDTVDYSAIGGSVNVNLSNAAGQNTGAGGIDTFAGIENLIGTAFNDTLAGGTANNRVEGGAGADSINGGAGNDVLFGGDANDRLVGGVGADQLYGGAGADTFVFSALNHSTLASSGQDTVFDFSHAEGDKIGLAMIDANTAAPGDQVFKLAAAFAHAAGQVVSQFDGGTGNYLVSGDINGDGLGDFAFQVHSATPLVAADFVL